jgi:hypothetical protein
VYRAAAEFAPAGRQRRPGPFPACETSLVWPAALDNPALARFVAFVRERAGDA